MDKQPENLVLRYRTFRQRHDVTITVLSNEAGIPKQHISEMELLERHVSTAMKSRLTDAMEAALFRRAASAAYALADFRMERCHLFDEVSEERK